MKWTNLEPLKLPVMHWCHFTYRCRLIGMCVFERIEAGKKLRKPNHQCIVTEIENHEFHSGVQLKSEFYAFSNAQSVHLEVRQNWMAHVRTVLRKCGGLHSNFVCCQISDTSIFISVGLCIFRARTDLLVRCDIVLMLSRSLRLVIWKFNISISWS